MSELMKRPVLRRLATAGLAVIGLAAVSAYSNPADARVWVSFGVGPQYSYAPYYPVYYNHWYHHHHWRWRHYRWCRWHPYACRW